MIYLNERYGAIKKKLPLLLFGLIILSKTLIFESSILFILIAKTGRFRFARGVDNGSGLLEIGGVGVVSTPIQVYMRNLISAKRNDCGALPQLNSIQNTTAIRSDRLRFVNCYFGKQPALHTDRGRVICERSNRHLQLITARLDSQDGNEERSQRACIHLLLVRNQVLSSLCCFNSSKSRANCCCEKNKSAIKHQLSSSLLRGERKEREKRHILARVI